MCMHIYMHNAKITYFLRLKYINLARSKLKLYMKYMMHAIELHKTKNDN